MYRDGTLMPTIEWARVPRNMWTHLYLESSSRFENAVVLMASVYGANPFAGGWGRRLAQTTNPPGAPPRPWFYSVTPFVDRERKTPYVAYRFPIDRIGYMTFHVEDLFTAVVWKLKTDAVGSAVGSDRRALRARSRRVLRFDSRPRARLLSRLVPRSARASRVRAGGCPSRVSGSA